MELACRAVRGLTGVVLGKRQWNDRREERSGIAAPPLKRSCIDKPAFPAFVSHSPDLSLRCVSVRASSSWEGNASRDHAPHYRGRGASCESRSLSIPTGRHGTGSDAGTVVDFHNNAREPYIGDMGLRAKRALAMASRAGIGPAGITDNAAMTAADGRSSAYYTDATETTLANSTFTSVNGSDVNQPRDSNEDAMFSADLPAESSASAVSPATLARRRFIDDKGAGDNVAAERAEMLARVLAPSGDCLPRIKLGVAAGEAEASAGWLGEQGSARANSTQPIRRAQRRVLNASGGGSSFPLSVASATTFVAACVVAAGAAFARHKSLPAPPAASIAVMVAPASLPVKDQVLGHYAVEEAPTSDLRPVLADGSVQLRTAAARAFLSMQDAARREGILLTPLSGFRSVRDQQSVFYGVKAARNQDIRQRAKVSAPRGFIEHHVRHALDIGASDSPATKVFFPGYPHKQVSAPPGFSEHHTGYALDIGDSDSPATHLEFDFENTEAFYWLQKNANRFHFELSFPPDNTRGIMYEPWHWRFVGDNHSTFTFYGERVAGTETKI